MGPSLDKMFYRPAEVAALIGLSRTTIYAWLSSGELPSVKVGRGRLIAADEVEALAGRIEAGTVTKRAH